VHPKLSNDRALRIVAAAREEYAKRGFAGARVEHIARRAGVNKQLLFYYYHSKRGLFQAVLTHAAGELERALTAFAVPAGRPLDRLRGALEAQFDFLAQHPELVSATTVWSLEGYTGAQLMDELWSRAKVRCRSMGDPWGVRQGCYLCNLPEDVDRTLATVRELVRGRRA